MDYDYDDYDDDYIEDDDYEGDTENMDNLMPLMEAAVLHGVGTNFTLLMENDVFGHSEYKPGIKVSKDYSIHPRYHQPCYGELRKYKATHPEECTQPGNEKPTDLWSPFPDGKPVAVGTNFFGSKNERYFRDCDMMIEEAFGEESPWRLGATQGRPKFVRAEKYLVGVILQDTMVDPTVMVNLFNNLKCRLSTGPVYKQLRDEGMTVREAFAVLLMVGRGSPLANFSGPDSYYTTLRISARRILEAKPRDLSGGLFSDRIDYNRTQLENVFMLDDKPVMTLADGLRKLGLGTALYGSGFTWKTGLPDKDKIRGLRDALQMVAESEPEQRDTKFNIETQTCDLIGPVEMKEAA
jgi:hypothetical protein